MKKLAISSFIIVALVIVIMFLSPYRYYSERKGFAIVETVEIDASKNELYRYLGNSANASNWSSYVSFIEPLNEDEFADGERNSRRRCYKKEEETVTWDEIIDSTKAPVYRRLSIYNLQGFSMESEALLTEQTYASLGNGSTRLSLTLFLDPGKASFSDHLKMYVASFPASAIFKKNLRKIKSLNE